VEKIHGHAEEYEADDRQKPHHDNKPAKYVSDAEDEQPGHDVDELGRRGVDEEKMVLLKSGRQGCHTYVGEEAGQAYIDEKMEKSAALRAQLRVIHVRVSDFVPCHGQTSPCRRFLLIISHFGIILSRWSYGWMKSIHDPRYAQLIQRLVTLREKVETTQTELAERLRKPQSYVAKVENLDRRLDVVEIADWLTALQTSPQRFMAELEWWH
jgi:hypothetical protein